MRSERAVCVLYVSLAVQSINQSINQSTNQSINHHIITHIALKKTVCTVRVVCERWMCTLYNDNATATFAAKAYKQQRPPAVRSSQFAVRSSQFAVRSSQFAVRSSQFAVRSCEKASQFVRSSFAVRSQFVRSLRSSFAVRSQFVRSSFAVRSQFVRRPAGAGFFRFFVRSSLTSPRVSLCLCVFVSFRIFDLCSLLLSSYFLPSFVRSSGFTVSLSFYIQYGVQSGSVRSVMTTPNNQPTTQHPPPHDNPPPTTHNNSRLSQHNNERTHQRHHDHDVS